ncbi:uncharacterized protein LOC135373138 [Ornithodoros turicata]|uniref:uncharacterized protein LOC135373138 n=1 Tax=Ornithodoros turicata TaxID=34597 RepID=UPI00313943BB
MFGTSPPSDKPSTTLPPPGMASSSSVPPVAHVAVWLPPFWTFNPTIWFLKVEAQFQLAGITTQATQYRHIVAVLPPDIALEVDDILSSPQGESPDDQLKDAILQRTTASERKRLQQLLTAEELGHRRPSQLLRAMQALIGDRAAAFDDSLLRELFMQRLPPQVQMILTTASSLSLSELAQHADKIVEVTGPSVAAVSALSQQAPTAPLPSSSSQQQIEELRAEVRNLSSMVSALSRRAPGRRPQRPRSSSRSRRRSASPVRDNSNSSGFCWYHETFGDAARKCLKPCAWSENAAGQR